MSPNRIKKILSIKPIGHYIVVDTDDHYHKWSIWQRTNIKCKASRFFYSVDYETPFVCKILDLDIIEHDVSKILCKRNSLDEKLAESGHIIAAKEKWGEFSRNFVKSPVAISKNNGNV
jgi:hypothetical protein